jgi:serine protease Do
MRGFGDIAERLRRSTVEVRLPGHRGGGSGVVWSASGLVLTNAHVARSPEAEVELWDGRRLAARLHSRDSRRDLALLRIAATDLEPATPGDSAALRPGELVMAVGSPLGFAGALSRGVVHSIGPIAGMGTQAWVRADVRLAPGNSGGPLANASGCVIGINTAIVNGLGVAVPSNAAAEFLAHGPQPALGVALRPVPLGLLLIEVDPEGAAALASLKPGDILLLSLDELHAALDRGQEVLRLRFLRGAANPSAGRERLPVREASVRLPVRRAEAA